MCVCVTECIFFICCNRTMCVILSTFYAWQMQIQVDWNGFSQKYTCLNMQHLIELKPRVQYSWYFAAWKCVIQKKFERSQMNLTWNDPFSNSIHNWYLLSAHLLIHRNNFIDRMKKIMITIRNKQQTKRRFPVNAVYVCLFIYIFSLSLSY